MTAATVFTSAFLLFLFADFAITVYLYLRQKRTLQDQRLKIPHEFTKTVSPAGHQRFTDQVLRSASKQTLRSIAVLAFLGILTLGGLLRLLTDWSASVFGNRILAGSLVVLVVAVIFGVINLLFSVKNYEGRSPFLCLFTAFIASVVTIVFWSSTGSAWWILSWLVCSLLAFAVCRISRAPANDISRLSDKALTERLNSFLRRLNFEPEGIYVSKAMNKSSEYGVCITGPGIRKRIILSAEILQKLTPAEIEAMLALKICRYRSSFGFNFFAVGFLLSFIFFAALFLLTKETWFYEGLGAAQLNAANHGAALVLFAAAVYVFLFPLRFLKNKYLWNQEFEAEKHTARLVDWNALKSAVAEVTAGKGGDVVPDYVYAVFNNSEPYAMARIKNIQNTAPRHTRQRDSWLPQQK